MRIDSEHPNPAVEVFAIDRNSMTPIHRQIETWLRRQIQIGAFPPGAKLPARREFCELLGGINHVTISKAVSSLGKEGLVFSVGGRGTFVADRSNKQLRVAIVLPNLEDEFTREIAAGIQDFYNRTSVDDGADSTGKNVATVVLDSWRDARKEEENIRHLEDLPIDGAIVLPLAYGDIVGKLARLISDRFPIVLVDEKLPGVKVSSVRSDNYGGGYQLATHLINSGHSSIAWIGALRWYNSARERYEGFRDAVCDAELLFDRKLTFDLETATPLAPYDDAMAAVVEKLCSIKKINAVFCDSGPAALLCMELLKKKGIRVPEDMAVVGFDDFVEAKFSQPPLTVICQPVREIGRRAAEILLKHMTDSSSQIEEVILPVNLIVRESSRRSKG